LMVGERCGPQLLPVCPVLVVLDEAGNWMSHAAGEARASSNWPGQESESHVHDELRQLHQQAGSPPLASLETHSGLAGPRVSKATFGNLLNGHGTPRWDTVEAFVTACVSYARSRRPPLGLPPNAADLDGWRARYDAAYPSTEVPGVAAFAAVRRDYLARLRERYHRVDLEVLTPLTEQDEHPAVGLREVFIAQTARADPPPVEEALRAPAAL